MRDYLINCVDSILRAYPECGKLLSDDLNQIRDRFIQTHYGLNQLVKQPARKNAILDKLWTNLGHLYEKPVVLDELGTSDHRMVLLIPSNCSHLDTGNLQHIRTRYMGHIEKAMYHSALFNCQVGASIQLAHLQFNSLTTSKTIMDSLITTSFPYKTVTRHFTDKYDGL